jgi:Zinc finger, C3HC4 type (RING finger)
MAADVPDVVPLSLHASYASHWNLRDATREICQNWRDGMLASLPDRQRRGFRLRRTRGQRVRDPLNFEGLDAGDRLLGRVVFDETTEMVRFVNKGTLDKKVLLMGYSSKGKDSGRRESSRPATIDDARTEAIGQFGEGLKVGLLCFLRAGRRVVCRTSGQEWKFALRPHAEFAGEETLAVEISAVPPASSGDDDGGARDDISPYTEFSISPLPEWRDYVADFLWLRPPRDCFEGEHGQLLFDDCHRGKLFVKGVFISSLEEEGGLQNGVNLWDLKLDRDRRAVVARLQVERLLVQLWSEALSQRPELVSVYFDMLNEDPGMETRMATRHLSELACNLIAGAFWDRHGADAVPVAWNDDDVDDHREKLRRAGREPVSVSSTLHKVLTRCTKLASFEQILADATRERAGVRFHQLTPDQVSVLERVVVVGTTVLTEMFGVDSAMMDLGDIDLVRFDPSDLDPADSSPLEVRLRLPRLSGVDRARRKILVSADMLEAPTVHSWFLDDGDCRASVCRCRERVMVEELLWRRLELSDELVLSKEREGALIHALVLAVGAAFGEHGDEHSKEEEQQGRDPSLFRSVETRLRADLSASAERVNLLEREVERHKSELAEVMQRQSKAQAQLVEFEAREQMMLAAQARAKLLAPRSAQATASVEEASDGAMVLGELLEKAAAMLDDLDPSKASGHDFAKVEAAARTLLERTSAAKDLAFQHVLDRLQSEKQRVEDSRLCSICSERPRNVALLPCKHNCLCQECADTQSRCPVCRAEIVDRIALFA